MYQTHRNLRITEKDGAEPMKSINGFSVNIPEPWYELPLTADVGMASEAILAELGSRVQAPEVVQALWEGLEYVHSYVTQELDKQTSVLAYIPLPESGELGGVATLVAQSPVSLQEFKGQLHGWPQEWPDVSFLRMDPIASLLPSGRVEGMHVLLEQPETDGQRELQERLTLGIFPDDCPDMVEVTCIATRLGSFTDMVAETLGLLSTLRMDMHES